MKQAPGFAKSNTRNRILTIALTFFSVAALSAQTQGQSGSNDSILSNGLFDAMLAMVILLLVIIMVLADVLKNVAAGIKQKESTGNGKGAAVVLLLLALVPLSAHAEETAKVASTVSGYGGMAPVAFWFMVSAIGFELVILAFIIVIIRNLLGVEERKDLMFAQKKIVQPSLLERVNASVSLEQEADIMLDHNYDGIRELDNNLPPWWKYGFYLTIVFAIVYLTHYHITKTGSLQIEEYNNELKQAEVAAAEYRKTSTNLVDEANVTLLTDAASLAEGKQIFETNCVACHGPEGGGVVGPNLTDDYWLHGGSIKDVFKTIKYGYPEKGMIAWKENLSPAQIAQVASYIKSLRGTKPANPKEMQGTLYVDESAAGTTPSKADSTHGK
jgi:cytochrome c oxidase cbb3-type subunit 3